MLRFFNASDLNFSRFIDLNDTPLTVSLFKLKTHEKFMKENYLRHIILHSLHANPFLEFFVFYLL